MIAAAEAEKNSCTLTEAQDDGVTPGICSGGCSLITSLVMPWEITIPCHLADCRCQIGFADAAETQLAAVSTSTARVQREAPMCWSIPRDKLTAHWVKISLWFNPYFVVSDHSGGCDFSSDGVTQVHIQFLNVIWEPELPGVAPSLG